MGLGKDLDFVYLCTCHKLFDQSSSRKTGLRPDKLMTSTYMKTKREHEAPF